MPQTAPLLQLAEALRLAHEKLSQVLTRPPEPEEIPAFCRTFLPQLEVTYLVRQDERPADLVELLTLSREHESVKLDPSVEQDGVHYRLNVASPWRGPFPSVADAYGQAWRSEVCGE
jgi:hypothetical protein